MAVDWVSSAPDGTSVVQVTEMPYGGTPSTEQQCAVLNRTGGAKGFGCCG